MALKALMLRKRIEQKNKELDQLRGVSAGFEAREAELTAAIEEAATEDEQRACEEAVEAFEAERNANAEEVNSLEAELRELEAELAAEEAAQNTDPVPAGIPAAPAENEARGGNKMPEIRNRFGLTEAIMEREDVQNFDTRVREAIRDKRALTNVGLTVPDVFLGIIRENIINYSKLYRHVNVRYISGQGRLVVMGTVPEAVWTECCANLNELTLGFYGVEVDCNKLGAFFAVCNAVLEDSAINLAAQVLEALLQAMGLALDKAILYGTGTKMPLGIVTRLAQTEAPGDYAPTARPWADLHTSNIKSHAASVTGTKLFAAIVGDSGAAKGAYARGEKVWVMNEATYTTLMAEALTVDASGRIVGGISDRMPVVGGAIEVLNFVPDNVIIGGYFDLYLLAERAGTQLAQSTEYRFVEDQTVFKGTARYDGAPVIAEAFVAIGINGVTPSASMTFASDTANA